MNDRLKQHLQEAIKAEEIYGVSFSLTGPKQNEVSYWGFQGKDQQRVALTPGMYYDLASLTKVVATTTRILQLVVQQKLQLSDTVGEFLPQAKSSALTIEELLLHRSGLIADLPNVRELTKEQLQAQVLQTLPHNEPGQVTEYSDLNYILLGWIISKIDGDLEQSVKDNVLCPLQMTQTTFKPAAALHGLCVPTEFDQERGLVQGQVHDGKAYLLAGVSGHAGLFSTLTDLIKFTNVLSGLAPNDNVMTSEVFTLLKKYDVGGRTLGWQRWSHGEQYWHTGFTGTSIAVDRNKQTGFVCLTNRIYPTRANRGFVPRRRQLLADFFGSKRAWND